jgi:hypothetical protein
MGGACRPVGGEDVLRMPTERYEVAYRTVRSPLARAVRGAVVLVIVLAIGVGIGAAMGGWRTLPPSVPGAIIGSLLDGHGWPTPATSPIQAPAQQAAQLPATPAPAQTAAPAPVVRQWSAAQCSWALQLLERNPRDGLLSVDILIRETTCAADRSTWPDVAIDGGPPPQSWGSTDRGPAMTASGCAWATGQLAAAQQAHQQQADDSNRTWASYYGTLISYFAGCGA